MISCPSSIYTNSGQKANALIKLVNAVPNFSSRWRELQLTIMRLILLVLTILLVFSSLSGAVPVVPNEAILRGIVLEYCLTSSTPLGIKPEQILYRLVISVKEVEDVKGYPNVLKSKESQSVTLYSKEKLPSELFGKEVKALVEYMGDERGGIFWIKYIEVIEQ